MRLHPLHNPDLLAQHMHATGEYFPVERHTGRTTALALETLAKAIRTPHEWVRITDHHPSLPADEHLMRMMQDMVHALGLQNMQFSAHQPAVCFGTRPSATPRFAGVPAPRTT